MLLTRCGHRRIPTLWRLLERNLSDNSRPPVPAASQEDEEEDAFSNITLPLPKMRALISLYHQADSWITPDNLLENIDKAFLNSDQLALSTKREESLVSVAEMKTYIQLMRNAPKMAQWDSNLSGGNDFYTSQWSEFGNNSRRDIKVIEALYGVTAFDHKPTKISQAFLPGLEVLRESAHTVRSEHEDDERLRKEREKEVCLIVL